MLRRAPVTVWIYVLAEFGRLLLLTGAVLVTVMAFAVAIKPLADGKIGPADALRYMALASVPMLQYALPFAAGFAATLAYHRLTADNELTACRAGGISPRAILVPALGAGLVLAGVVALLSNQIIPYFLKNMEGVLREDATRLMVSSIARGEPVPLGKNLIYADEVRRLGPDEKSGAYERLYLSGVLVAQIDRGVVEAEGSAKDAVVWFYKNAGAVDGGGAGTGGGGRGGQEGEGEEEDRREGENTLVVMRPQEFVGRKAGEAAMEAEPTLPYVYPTIVQDNPRFMTSTELAAAERRPEMLNGIDAKRAALVARIGERERTEGIDRALRTAGKVDLVDEDGGRATLRAGGMRVFSVPDAYTAKRLGRPPTAEEADLGRHEGYWRLEPSPLGDPIGLERVLASGGVQRFRAARGYVRSVAAAGADQGLTLTLRLEEVTAVGASSEPTTPRRAGGGGGGTVEFRRFERLLLAEDPSPVLGALTTPEAIARAEAHLARLPGDGYVRYALDVYKDRLRRLHRDILAKRNERWAISATCLVMVLTGGVMAIRLKDALPLRVYLWSFFPALGSVLAVAGGQQVVAQHGAIGLLIVWGGVLGLAVFTLGEYKKVARR